MGTKCADRRGGELPGGRRGDADTGPSRQQSESGFESSPFFFFADRTRKAEFQPAPGEAAAAEPVTSQGPGPWRAETPPDTHTPAASVSLGEPLQGRVLAIASGHSSRCPPQSPGPRATLRPGTPPAPRYRLPGRWSRSPRPSRSRRTRLRGPRRCPARSTRRGPAGAPDASRASAAPDEVRLESGPARGGRSAGGRRGKVGSPPGAAGRGGPDAAAAEPGWTRDR